MPSDSAVERNDELAVAIRGYLPADRPQVCCVHDRARVLELAGGGVDTRAFRPMEEVAERDEFFASQTLVACAGGTVVGFISWNGTYITWLYVDPALHRRGIGRRLLREALCRIGPDAWTSILEGNEPARALYRAAGMEVVWTRPSDCEGYACLSSRLALPTSRTRDPSAQRQGGDSQPPTA